jgi:hypothetical protein
MPRSNIENPHLTYALPSDSTNDANGFEAVFVIVSDGNGVAWGELSGGGWKICATAIAVAAEIRWLL